MNKIMLKITLGLLLLVSFNVNAATYKNISALGCKAVFLDQAYDLKWDSIRLSNRHPSLSRWVVCPIDRSSSSSPESGFSGYINYQYSAATKPSTPNMTCILREINYYGYVENARTFDLVNPGANTSEDLPINVSPGSFSNSDYNYWTMSCKLPPLTSLVSFDLTIEP